LDIASDSKVQQPGQQDVYVAGSIKHAGTVWHSLKMMKNSIHVLASKDKRNEEEQAKD